MGKKINSNISKVYSLTPLQEGMLFHKLLDENTASYVIQNVFEVTGELDLNIAKKALNFTALKHDSLRTLILYNGIGEPKQVVLSERNLEFTYWDLTAENNQEEKIKEIKINDIKRGFDLEKDSLFRSIFVKVSPDKMFMIWSFHHIILDGWCVSIIYHDFLYFYFKIYDGKSEEKIRADITRTKVGAYGDYVAWLEKQDIKAGLDYWSKLLQGYQEIASIPSINNTRNIIMENQVERKIANANLHISSKLQQYSKDNNVTINTVVEAAFGILLQRYNNTNDVVFGKVVSGRNADVAGIEEITGLFINTIPQRVVAGEDTTLDALVQGIQEQSIDSMNYDYCSLAEIQAQTALKDALIQVLFIFENYYVTETNDFMNIDNLKIKAIDNREQTNYDITFVMSFDQYLKYDILYNPKKYTEQEIEMLITRMDLILSQIVEEGQKKVSEVEIVTQEEKDRFLHGKQTKYCYPQDKTIVEVFEAYVEKEPDRIAAVYEGEKLTYRELNEKANQVARSLRDHGVQKEDMVMMHTSRSLEMLIGIYGILKAGGAYVPVDTSYPEERKRYILKDCNPKAVLLNQDLGWEEEIAILDLREEALYRQKSHNLSSDIAGENLMYVIYTSGTTGKPKGVMITHKNVMSLIKNETLGYEFGKEDKWLQFHSYCFDFSVWEIFGSTLTGGTLVIASKETVTDSYQLLDLLEKEKITILNQVPSSFYQLSGTEEERGGNYALRYLIFGGEKLNPKRLEKWHEKHRETKIVNMYGITETTVHSTYQEIGEKEIQMGVSTIGKGLSTLQIYIRSKSGRLCGVGMPGEICIAGEGVSRGYLNQEKLTKEKFIDNPYGEGKLYQSGDLGRWQEDGSIEYLGRMDDQVKIRGFRIELGEIESVLRKQENIIDVAVIIRKDKSNENAICAYVVMKEKLKAEQLKEKLRKELPEYMIPVYIKQLEKIPTTANGKLDKRNLPEIESVSTVEYQEPRTLEEIAVSESFMEVLGVARAGAYDNFFELGGDSIKAIRIVSKMRGKGYSISVKDVMKERVVERIAKQAKTESKEKYVQTEIRGEVKETPILHDFLHEWKLRHPEHYNQDYMVKSKKFEKEAIKKALEEVVKHHDMLRAVYQNGKIRIRAIGEGRLYDYKEYDMREKEGEELEKEALEVCNEIQRSMNLEEGPLVKAGLIKAKEEEHLFLCIHHMVIDGVSWRILLEDLKTGYEQYQKNGRIQLEKKTASYKEWSEMLREYSRSSELEKEETYWKKIEKKARDCERMEEKKPGTDAGYGSLEIGLGKEATQDLLYRAGKAYGTEINDILMASLGLAMKESVGKGEVVVELEGHGRESIHKEVEIDRTIGWFTSMYPVIIEAGDSIEETVIEVKEMLRRIPNKGMGYGVLRLAEKVGKVGAEIRYNYLGEYDIEGGEKKGEEFEVSELKRGNASGEGNENEVGISFDGIIERKELRIRITYDRARHDRELIEKIGNTYIEKLKEVIRHCTQKKEIIRTASDLGISDISHRMFQKIVNQYGTEKIDEMYPLTPMQEGMLFHRLLDEDSTSYFIQQTILLKEYIDIEKVKVVLNILTKQHDVLRTSITYGYTDRPYQLLIKGKEIELICQDLRGDLSQDKNIEKIQEEDIMRGFDLEKDSLVRVTLVRLSEDETLMIWSFHHIIMDGWCVPIVLTNFMDYYQRLMKGVEKEEIEKEVIKRKSKLAPYKDYISWIYKQNEKKAIEYWEAYLKDYSLVADIIPLGNMDKIYKSQVKQLQYKIEDDLYNKIQRLSMSNQVTINTIFEVAWGILLQQYNDCDDVVFGKVVSGRNVKIEGIEEIVGLFINTIPVRMQIDDLVSIEKSLREMQNNAIESIEYDFCSLPKIQAKTNVGNNLIKTLLIFENYYIDEKFNLLEDTFKFTSNREQTNYNITLYVIVNNGITLQLLYNPQIYSKDESLLLLDRLNLILMQMTQKPKQRVADINIVLDDEIELVNNIFNNTKAEYPVGKCIHELFEEQVQNNFDKKAIVFENKTISYNILNEKANQIAWKLSGMGIGRNDYVGIISKRSIEMVIALYAVMKSGAAFVPIDPEYPEDRIKYILEDCKPKCLLMEKELLPIHLNIPIIDIFSYETYKGNSNNRKNINQPDDILYMIYTSGTTGKPKGTMITHKCVNNYISENCFNVYGRIINNQYDKMISVTTISFDIFVTEIILPLLHGMTVYLANENEQNFAADLKQLIMNSGVQIMQTTPSKMKMYLMDDENPEFLNKLKCIMLGGEMLTEDLILKLNQYSNAEIFNVYGPTETTVWSTIYNVPRGCNKIYIGTPIANTQIYILNKRKKICGIGVLGELCIAGEGVAKGYWNQKELTDTKFIPNPYGDNKLYCTGDIARWLTNGNIEYFGRNDNQIKIRGLRVELKEIESVICAKDFINDAVVLVKNNQLGEMYICAYIVSSLLVDTEIIKEILRRELPEHMIPSVIILVDKIPISKNGKIDYNRLPEVEFINEVKYEGARSEEEQLLVDILKDILDVPKISIWDNFFELGGDSIKAVLTVSKLKRKGYKIKVKDILQGAVIGIISKKLELI